MRSAQLLLLALILPALSACTSMNPSAITPVEVVEAKVEISEVHLLDVGIETFQPGLDKDEAELAEEGVFPAVRKAEARFIPIQLRNTLQDTGQWGAVRIVPKASDAVDVFVHGKILRSDGEALELEVRVTDSSGREWMNRRYEAEANANSYTVEEVTDRDPFQNIYNTIANDMVRARDRLMPDQLANLREVSELRFAIDIAPEAFSGYLATASDGNYVVRRLPAQEDPMIIRVRRLRERDLMLIDTLNEHYANFGEEMDDSYEGWRKYSYEEVVAYNELKRSARIQQVLGVAAVLGGIAAAAAGIPAAEILAPTLILGGAAVFKRGMDRSEESEIHADAIRELGTSFDSEVAPMVIEIEGQTMELQGSADEQYENWRRILRRIYSSETGFELIGSPNSGTLPAQVPQPTSSPSTTQP